jgi:hypothetical protein
MMRMAIQTTTAIGRTQKDPSKKKNGMSEVYL